uniref:Uncharacterized protein n=1 Tax=Plectus sambesii TaxID=2011161 RepID=A0A914WYH0_9BILA
MTKIFPRKPPKPCKGILCLNVSSRSVSKRSNDSLSCSRYRLKLHFACEGIAIESEIIPASKGAHECLRCKRADGLHCVVDVAKMNAEKAQKALDEQLEKQSEMECRLALVKDIVINKNGPYSQRLAQALEELGVEVQAYHSCTFVGNHMHKMLQGDGPSRLAGALDDDSEDKAKFERLFTSLGRVQSCFKASLLNEDEIAELEQSCEQFACDVKELLLDESVTPKIHFLVAHLPTFARRYNTLDLLSEQSLESLHAKVNRLEQQFATSRVDKI